MLEKKNHRILVVDDDRDILDLLAYNLEKEGFKVKVLEESEKAVKTALTFKPDLIILDIMMPGLSGIEVCKLLRKREEFKDTYIFFLTAKSENYYQVAALDTGGDDFIEKIVGLRALTHKVKTVLKKNFIIRKSVPEIDMGQLKINRKSGTVLVDEREIKLSKPEFELLFFFAQNPEKIISSESLQDNITGSDSILPGKSIESYISNLSNKLGHRLIMKVNEGKYRFNLGSRL